jgi:cysteine synthase
LARQIADQVESAVIVTILPDSADKYLSEAFWNQE